MKYLKRKLEIRINNNFKRENEENKESTKKKTYEI